MTRKEMMSIIDARRRLLVASQPHIFAQDGTGWAFTVKHGHPWDGGFLVIVKIHNDDTMTTRYWRWGADVEEAGTKVFFRSKWWSGRVDHIFEWDRQHG